MLMYLIYNLNFYMLTVMLMILILLINKFFSMLKKKFLKKIYLMNVDLILLQKQIYLFHYHFT